MMLIPVDTGNDLFSISHGRYDCISTANAYYYAIVFKRNSRE